MRSLLFVTYGGGHVDIVLSLLPRLRALGVPTTVLALTTAVSRLRGVGEPCRTPHDYLPLAGYEHAMALGAELSAPLWDATSQVSWDYSCAYLGLSMLDLIAECGDAEAWRRYEELGRKAFCPTRFLHHVLAQENPGLVVTTCHVRMERAAVLAARQRGCPSVLIEDLFGYALLGDAALEAEPQLLAQPERPDAVIVLNQAVRQRLLQAGMPPHQVHALGQPVFADWVARLRAAEPAAELADWRPVITYAAPSRPEVLHRHTAALVAIAQRHGNWGVVIKLHPSTRLDVYRAAVGVLPANVLVLAADHDILPVVQGSDLVVVFRSTVGMLSLFAGLPLVVFDDTGEPEVMPYVSSGAASGAATAEQLEQAIARQLTGPTAARSLQHPLFENPPDAPERIAAWLRDRLAA